MPFENLQVSESNKIFRDNLSAAAALSLIVEDWTEKQRIPVLSHTSFLEKVDIWEASEEEDEKSVEIKEKQEKKYC